MTNAQPGYPALAGKTVNVDQIEGLLPVRVASGTTSATGAYTIRFAPASTGSYAVGTPQIAQIENSTLNPVFGDLLTPGSTTPVTVTVHSTVTSLRATLAGGLAVVFGSVAPGTGHVKATVRVFARRAGSKRAFRRVATDRLATNDGNFAVAASLAAGRWQLKVAFQDAKQVVGTTSRTVTVTVAAKPATSVTVRSLTVSRRAALTITASVKPKPGAGKVKLLALNTTAGKAARFGVFATATVHRAKVTLHARLRHANRYVLQLEYTTNNKHQATPSYEQPTQSKPAASGSGTRSSRSDPLHRGNSGTADRDNALRVVGAHATATRGHSSGSEGSPRVHPYDTHGRETFEAEAWAATLSSVPAACPGCPQLSTSSAIEPGPERLWP